MNVDPNTGLFPISEIEKFSVHRECIETLPCQHECNVQFYNGNSHKITLYADEISQYLTKIPANRIDRDHFSDLFQHFSLAQPNSYGDSSEPER